jgi:hypothetical protein
LQKILQVIFFIYRFAIIKEETLKKKELQQAIKEKEKQLSKLEQHIYKSKTCAEVYDKLVLEKAIQKKELDDLYKNKFVERVKKLIPHKKTLICDYFTK